MDPAPAPHMIRISGHLGATVLSAFPALAPQHHSAHTVLTGLLDRSALYGVLAEIEALGLDLPARSGDPLLLLKAAGSRGQDHQDLRCPRSGRANHRDPVTPPHLPGGEPGSGPPPGRKFQQRIDMDERAWSAAKPTQPKGDPP